MKKFIIKHKQTLPLFKKNNSNAVKNNVTEKKVKNMNTSEKIKMASEVMSEKPKVKKLKRDKGLIERTESSIMVLTEDNKELLKD